MRLETINLSDIKIEDRFWTKHIHLVKDVILPYQWDIMNDKVPGAESSRCLENFKIAAGRIQGEFYGAVFQDTDIAKWMEAVGYSLSSGRNQELEALADGVVDLLAEAQQPDGYMDTYFIIREPDKKWKDLCEGHELYTAGHMMEAAVAYYNATGKRKFLDCVLKLADLICETFGPGEGQNHGYPGHQEVEIGLIKLYETTGNRKYLDMAKYFLDIRGLGENYFLKEQKSPGYLHIFPEFEDYDPKYSQSHKPVREQDTAEGHAVRAVYMYCAMADVASAYGDEAMLEACRRLWDNITEKRMYITGGIGSSGILERFTTDYDLPNDYNYSETCASIGMALFSLRMANITRESKYADVVELELYNNILAGVALNGKRFFYVNPLEVIPGNCIPRTSREHVKEERQRWFGVACCPPNIARTLASLGQYIYGIDKDHIYMHLFISGQSSFCVGNSTVSIGVESELPWQGEVRISLTGVPESGVCINFRIPAYARDYTIYSGGRQIPFDNCRGYARVRVTEDTELQIHFSMEPVFVRADVKVSSDVGKVAVMRGPLVYCLEERDNGNNLAALFADTEKGLWEEQSDEFGGIIAVRFQGKRMVNRSRHLYEIYEPQYETREIRAIPYAYWNNRGVGEMAVWVKAIIK